MFCYLFPPKSTRLSLSGTRRPQNSHCVCRLFPFKRGLLHAYWAPNVWALYAGIDRVLGAMWRRMGWLQPQSLPSTTSGLVQESIFQVLPQVHCPTILFDLECGVCGLEIPVL